MLKDGGGALIGLEITELVNGKAIDAQIQGRPDYFATALAFGVSSAIERLSETVQRKDRKAIKVYARYSDYVLLVPCAEPWLSRDNLARAAAAHTWPKTHGIGVAYLMFDYHPSDPYRIVKLFDTRL